MLQILGEATSEEVDLILQSGVKSKEKLSADDFLKSLEIKLKQVRGEFPEFPERDGEYDHDFVQPVKFNEKIIGPEKSYPASFSFCKGPNTPRLKPGMTIQGTLSILFSTEERQGIHRTIRNTYFQIVKVSPEFISISPLHAIYFEEKGKKFGFTSSKIIKVYSENIQIK